MLWILLVFSLLFLLIFFYFYLLNFERLVESVRFISYHHLVFFYYFLNILIFFVGLNAIFYYNNMTSADFMGDFKEFKVLYEVFENDILPEIFPEYFKKI